MNERANKILNLMLNDVSSDGEKLNCIKMLKKLNILDIINETKKSNNSNNYDKLYNTYRQEVRENYMLKDENTQLQRDIKSKNNDIENLKEENKKLQNVINFMNEEKESTLKNKIVNLFKSNKNIEFNSSDYINNEVNKKQLEEIKKR